MPPYAGGHLAIDIGDSYGLPCGGGLSSDDGADDTQRSDGEPTNRTCGGGSGGDGEGRMKPAPPVTLSWPGCGDMIFWQLGERVRRPARRPTGDAHTTGGCRMRNATQPGGPERAQPAM